MSICTKANDCITPCLKQTDCKDFHSLTSTTKSLNEDVCCLFNRCFDGDICLSDIRHSCLLDQDCASANFTCVNNECLSVDEIKKHQKPNEAWTIIILMAAIVFLASQCIHFVLNRTSNVDSQYE